MKRLLIALPFCLAAPATADNVAQCEIVLMQEVVEGAGAVASFRPAYGFFEGVYDDAVETVTHIDDHPIRAVMCTRSDVIPTAFDWPIVKTGVPFILSSDFDSTDAPMVTVKWTGQGFEHAYAGPELSETDTKSLADVMEMMNLQAHDLPRSDPNTRKAEAAP